MSPEGIVISQAWVAWSLTSGLFVGGFGVGYIVGTFQTKRKCGEYRREIYNKISGCVDKLDDKIGKVREDCA